MGDSTFTKAGVVQESTFGTVPASALQLINVSDAGGPQMTRNAAVPPVLTGDRRRHAKRELSAGGEWTLSMPGQYENDLLILEALLGSTRGTAKNVSGTGIAFTATSITDSGNQLAVFEVGDFVYVTGTVTNTPARWYGPVLTVAAGTLTFPAATFSIEGAGTSFTLKSRRVVDGTTRISLSTESHNTDLTKFRSMKGACVTSGSWKWGSNEWVQQSYSLSGLAPVSAGATIGTGTATAAKTSGALNCIGNYKQLRFGSQTSSTAIFTSLGLEIKSNMAPIMGIGSLGPSDFSPGPFDIDVTASLYYDATAYAFLTDAEAYADTKYLQWAVADPEGNQMCFFVPGLKVDKADPKGGAAGTPKSIDCAFSSFDPAKASGSSFYLAGAFPFQFAAFFVPV